jgi:hypothetical protein
MKWIFIVLFLSPLALLAQSPWIELEEKDGVKISYRYADCDMKIEFDQVRVLLRFENKTSQRLEVFYHADLTYSGNCLTCEDPSGEYNRSFNLSPNEVLEGKCGESIDNHLYFFVKWSARPNETELTDFYLKNLTIEPIK